MGQTDGKARACAFLGVIPFVFGLPYSTKERPCMHLAILLSVMYYVQGVFLGLLQVFAYMQKRETKSEYTWSVWFFHKSQVLMDKRKEIVLYQLPRFEQDEF